MSTAVISWAPSKHQAKPIIANGVFAGTSIWVWTVTAVGESIETIRPAWPSAITIEPLYRTEVSVKLSVVECVPGLGDVQTLLKPYPPPSLYQYEPTFEGPGLPVENSASVVNVLSSTILAILWVAPFQRMRSLTAGGLRNTSWLDVVKRPKEQSNVVAPVLVSAPCPVIEPKLAHSILRLSLTYCTLAISPTEIPSTESSLNVTE